MAGLHHYQATIIWTGNNGTGTNHYQSYERSHTIKIIGKPDILSSSDPAYRGDAKKHNPEDLFLASIASCHMLWYLHLCAEAGVVVTQYEDNATGAMSVTEHGGGKFIEVSLHPVLTVQDQNMIDKANALHAKANELCFIANSLNFPVKHNCTINSL